MRCELCIEPAHETLDPTSARTPDTDGGADGLCALRFGLSDLRNRRTELPENLRLAGWRGIVADLRTGLCRADFRAARLDRTGHPTARGRRCFLEQRVRVAAGFVAVSVSYTHLDVYKRQLYTRPLIYRNARALLAECPDSDLVFATHWNTVDWVHRLLQTGRTRAAGYLIQDYEPWFFPDTAAAQRCLLYTSRCV